jgi:hypothetical protein
MKIVFDATLEGLSTRMDLINKPLRNGGLFCFSTIVRKKPDTIRYR